jgi:hypothetical protein
MENPVDTGRLLIFDNIQGLCPNIEEQSTQGGGLAGLVTQVKSKRLTDWLCRVVEQNCHEPDEPRLSIAIVARHFSLVNSRLLDIGYFDNLIELSPPTKEQRYDVIKSTIAPVADQIISESHADQSE